MKKTLIIVILVIIAIVVQFFVLSHISKSGKALGLLDGKLQKCPAKPNCVCSEQKGDGDHYVDPILIPPGSNNILKILEETIQESGGIIQTNTDTYLAATFSSAVFGFVDDVEFRIDSAQNAIHIRSASRVGYGDLKVNKKRTESIRELFIKKAKNGIPVP